MKPLSGRESSILALLAQSQSLSENDKDKILQSLDGQALKIAKAIIDKSNVDDKNIRIVADGFIAWANNIPIVGA